VTTAASIASIGEADVLAALAEVPDPEIPVVSIVDLGLVHMVRVDESGIRVELLPTFVGCPALEIIREAAATRLSTLGRPVDVRFSFDEPWTSDRITPTGLEALRRHGFAPPGPASQLVVLDAAVLCPYCGSSRTRLENLFGPTQCRSIRYCTACRQPFEHFKTI